MLAARRIDLARVLPAFALFVGITVTMTMTIVGDARADIISDNQAVCRDKAAGDACEVDGKAGKCAKSTCSRNDYSGGTPPKQVSSECLICEPETAAASPPTRRPRAAAPPGPVSPARGCSVRSSSGSAWSASAGGAARLADDFCTNAGRRGDLRLRECRK
jgi:hypothetical protein